MHSTKKRLPTESPRKIQTEMTSFTGKRVDNKNSPPRSDAQVVSANRFESLSDPEDEDKEMAEVQSSDNSDMTPKKDNAKSTTTDTNKHQNPLSKRSQQRLAKAGKTDAKKTSKSNQNLFLSSATKATLERARKAKELLQNSSSCPQNDKTDIAINQDDKIISQTSDDNGTENSATSGRHEEDSNQSETTEDEADTGPSHSDETQEVDLTGNSNEEQ